MAITRGAAARRARAPLLLLALTIAATACYGLRTPSEAPASHISDGGARSSSGGDRDLAAGHTLRAEEDRVAELPGAPGPLQFGMFAG